MKNNYICQRCGKEFISYHIIGKSHQNKYCSAQCYYKIRWGKSRKRYVNCFICEKKICKSLSQIKKNINQKFYCSRGCMAEDKIERKKRGGENLKCLICAKIFYVKPSYIKKAKYCSRKCRCESRKIPESKVKLKCKFCKKEYITERSHIKWRGSAYCSKVCVKKYKKTKFFLIKKENNTNNVKLKKLLWTIFSRYIRQRDGGVCISCGKIDNWKNMDAGHYIPKTAGLSLYFDERNVNCQCTYCNRWMHGNLSRYAIALRKKYGETILEDLDKLRGKTIQISIPEYQKMIEKYKDNLEKLCQKKNEQHSPF